MTGNGKLLCVIILVSGCATETYQGDTSGKLTCVGYCEMDVENRTQTVKTTEADGKVIEKVNKSTGVSTGGVK